jgi:ATP-dependent exoDNAse (exonuclease V) alpha subunit
MRRWRKATWALILCLALAGCGATKTTTVTDTTPNAQQREELASLKAKTEKAREKLAETKQKVSDERGRLERLQAKSGQAKQAIAENTISGTGTFEVGKDIQPGTYRAEARSGCYWARLSSLNTSDIIDNNNADGPVVVEIKASDRAFETSGCADFHRAG